MYFYFKLVCFKESRDELSAFIIPRHVYTWEGYCSQHVRECYLAVNNQQ